MVGKLTLKRLLCEHDASLNRALRRIIFVKPRYKK